LCANVPVINYGTGSDEVHEEGRILFKQ